MRALLNLPQTHDDAMSMSMFWAGALMVFAPIVFASIVLGVWWWQRRARPADLDAAYVPAASAQERGSATQPT